MLFLLLSFPPVPPVRYQIVSGDVVALTRETITVRSNGEKTFPLQKDMNFSLPRREFGGIEYMSFSVAMGEFILQEFRIGVFKGRVDVKLLRGKVVLVTQLPPKE